MANINSQESVCLNITLAIITSLVLLLTSCEFLVPLVTFIMGVYDLISYKYLAIIENDTLFLLISAAVTTGISIALFMVYFLQLNFTFKKNVMILRHIVNILYTAAIICLLISTKKHNETKLLQNLSQNWGNSDPSLKYQSQHNCTGYTYNNTDPQNCYSSVQNDVHKLYNFSRMFVIPCSLWWAPVILYSILSIILIIIDRKFEW